MVRTTVATKGCALLGTRQRKVCMKRVRQRCQLAPGKLCVDCSREAEVVVTDDELHL